MLGKLNLHDVAYCASGSSATSTRRATAQPPRTSLAADHRPARPAAVSAGCATPACGHRPSAHPVPRGAVRHRRVHAELLPVPPAGRHPVWSIVVRPRRLEKKKNDAHVRRRSSRCSGDRRLRSPDITTSPCRCPTRRGARWRGRSPHRRLPAPSRDRDNDWRRRRAALGAAYEPRANSALRALRADYRTVFRAESYAFPPPVGRAIAGTLPGPRLSAASHGRSGHGADTSRWQHLQHAPGRRGVFRRVDLIVTPTVPVPAPSFRPARAHPDTKSGPRYLVLMRNHNTRPFRPSGGSAFLDRAVRHERAPACAIGLPDRRGADYRPDATVLRIGASFEQCPPQIATFYAAERSLTQACVPHSGHGARPPAFRIATVVVVCAMRWVVDRDASASCTAKRRPLVPVSRAPVAPSHRSRLRSHLSRQTAVPYRLKIHAEASALTAHYALGRALAAMPQGQRSKCQMRSRCFRSRTSHTGLGFRRAPLARPALRRLATSPQAARDAVSNISFRDADRSSFPCEGQAPGVASDSTCARRLNSELRLGAGCRGIDGP